MALKRYNRLQSDTKPAAIKASTWSMLQGHAARRKSLLSGKGNAAKAKSVANTLRKVRSNLQTHRPTIAYDVKAALTHALRHRTPSTPGPKPGSHHTISSKKRIRLGSPLRHIPGPFKKKTWSI